MALNELILTLQLLQQPPSKAPEKVNPRVYASAYLRDDQEIGATEAMVLKAYLTSLT